MRKTLSHKFRGVRYQIKHARKMPKSKKGKLDGWVANPKVPRPLMLVRHSLRGKRRLIVEIHEALHACYWDMAESAVDAAAESIGKLLWKLGYRLQ